ncbi:protein FAM166B-like [Callorhinchus milii]|uniref:protein FAM166B-like n=1 Tax=Callorhinchus milii TaxID=7868 RepID=UPI0004571B70|nr:protein FAM166B-like [Callorhinchus milii]|eukprot:gi/632984596/ref/XP_007909218.1/ PREDICTED: protein FAM166B-like [Callorhinchus milii]
MRHLRVCRWFLSTVFVLPGRQWNKRTQVDSTVLPVQTKQRYAGYCPKYPHQTGKTFGKTTLDLLASHANEGSHSLLAPINAPQYYSDDENCIPYSPGVSDQIFGEKLIPGYTGYVPQRMYKFGNSYNKESLDCGMELLKNKVDYQRKKNEPILLTYRDGGTRLATSGENRPLKAVASKVDPVSWTHLYKHKHLFTTQPPELQRRGIAGYTGFVPEISKIYSHPYSERVKQAMDTFQHKQYFSRNKIKSCPKPFVSQVDNEIYHKAGMVPHYGGHMPEKFSMHNADEKFPLGVRS